MIGHDLPDLSQLVSKQAPLDLPVNIVLGFRFLEKPERLRQVVIEYDGLMT